MLIPPVSNATTKVPPPGPIPFTQGEAFSAPPTPACTPGAMPALRSRTAGYRPSLDNADGNVISQRRPSGEAVQWSPTVGDTRYRYTDVVVSGVVTSMLPWHWARRANVVGIFQHPKGGTVQDEIEGTPGTFQSSKGRYALYEYEPFFNQVSQVVSGQISSAGALVPSLTTTVIFDYQEESLSALTPLLDRLQAAGFQFEIGGSRATYLFSTIASHLPIKFGLGDVNGDGIVAATSSGLPSRVLNVGAGTSEFSAHQQNLWADRA